MSYEKNFTHDCPFGSSAIRIYANLLSDNFDDENISDWTAYDQDGDGYNWETVNLGTGYTGAIASYSYDNASSSALTPNKLHRFTSY